MQSIQNNVLEVMARELAEMEKKIRLMRIQIDALRPRQRSKKEGSKTYRVGSREFKI